MGLLFALLNPLNFDEICIVTNLKYIITVCYDVIILYNFLPMHSFFFPLVYLNRRVFITIFHISAQNIDCGYLLEPPRPGSNEYPQYMLLSRNKKNNIYPCKPQFYYIKMGLRRSNFARFRDELVYLHSLISLRKTHC